MSTPPPYTAPNVPSAMEIAMHFTAAYYGALYQEQYDELYQFYRSDAEVTMAFENAQRNVRGSEAIKHLHSELFTNCRNVKIEHLDAQFSASQQLLLINVHGLMTLDQVPHGRFVQSFLLNEESAATYFVQNDLFRSYGVAPGTAIVPIMQEGQVVAAGREAPASGAGKRRTANGGGDVASVKSDTAFSDVDSTNATVGTMSTVTGVFDHDNLPSDVGSESSVFASHKELNGHAGSVKSDDVSSRDDESIHRKDTVSHQQQKREGTTQKTEQAPAKKAPQQQEESKEEKQSPADTSDKKAQSTEQQKQKKKSQKKKKRANKDTDKPAGSTTAEAAPEKPKQPEGPVTYASIVGLMTEPATTTQQQTPEQPTKKAATGASTTSTTQQQTTTKPKKNRKPKKTGESTENTTANSTSTTQQQDKSNEFQTPKTSSYQRSAQKSKGRTSNAIFVSRLPQDISDSTLRSHFEKFGRIVDINNKTAATRAENPQYYAFIFYEREESVQKALEQNKKITIGNHVLNIERRRSNEHGGKGGNKGNKDNKDTTANAGQSGAGRRRRPEDANKSSEQKVRNGRRRANSGAKEQAKF